MIGAILSIAFSQKVDYCIYRSVSTRAEVEFAWDERKSGLNKRKHGISFDLALLVFEDPFHVSQQDREAEGEERWQTIGMVQGLQVLLVAHTVEEEGDLVRIFFARKATPRERRIYAQGY